MPPTPQRMGSPPANRQCLAIVELPHADVLSAPAEKKNAFNVTFTNVAARERQLLRPDLDMSMQFLAAKQDAETSRDDSNSDDLQDTFIPEEYYPYFLHALVGEARHSMNTAPQKKASQSFRPLLFSLQRALEILDEADYAEAIAFVAQQQLFHSVTA